MYLLPSRAHMFFLMKGLVQVYKQNFSIPIGYIFTLSIPDNLFGVNLIIYPSMQTPQIASLRVNNNII